VSLECWACVTLVVGEGCNELILLRLAQKIVCSSHQIYMTWLLRRSVRKHRVRIVTVGFILVLLVQRVSGWVCFGISWLWFRRLLVLLVLACRRVDLTTAGSCVSGCSWWPPLLPCRRVAPASLVAPWTRREFGLVGLGKCHRSQTRVDKPCSPGQRLSRLYLSLALSRTVPLGSCSDRAESQG